MDSIKRKHVITEAELLEVESSYEQSECFGHYESKLVVEALRAQHEEIGRLHAGITQLTEIIEGMLSGNGHDPQEVERIRTTYPLAFELLIGNGLLP